MTKMEIKYGDPYKICKNCKGNGYVRLAMYEETQTCKKCGGAGHFERIKKHKIDKGTLSTKEVLKMLKLLEEFIRGKRTIH